MGYSIDERTRLAIIEIEHAPTTLDNIHQSVYRSSHILEYVKWLLEEGTPSNVVRDIISGLEALPQLDTATAQAAERGERVRTWAKICLTIM